MTDKITAEKELGLLAAEAFEQVKIHGGSHGVFLNELHLIVRQALSAPRVPEGWNLWKDSVGNLRLDDVDNDLHIAIHPDHRERGGLFLEVVGGFLEAMLEGGQK